MFEDGLKSNSSIKIQNKKVRNFNSEFETQLTNKVVISTFKNEKSCSETI